MKQVININYHGRIIPIEVNAYEMLKNYTTSLQIHFKDEEGKEEIINDIESRISELFQEQLTKGSSCITESDVNAVVNSMGRPEELESEPIINQNSSDNRKQQNDSTTHKRLYRDENNKFFGGVCSGLANYFNTDKVIVRIIFLILFFSFGVGLIPYLILWIAVPSSASKEIGSMRKKLYRDTEEKVIAGVCSGLAHYFGINVWIPRTLFLLPVLSMIFEWNHFLFNVSPSSFVIYLIFWLVMPEAKTTSEKLEMKGEKVDMNSIQAAINEEMKGVKERAEKLGAVAGEKIKDIRKDSSSAFKRLINVIIEVIVFIVKFISYTTLTMIGLALVLFLLAITLASFVALPFKDFILNGFWQNSFALGTLLFFVILATVGIIVALIKKIAGIKTKNKWVTTTFIALWVLGWISLFGLASTLGSDFSKMSHRDSNEKEISITQPLNGKLIVNLNKHPYFHDDEDKSINFFEALDLFKDSMFIDNVDIKVLRSLDDSFHIRLVNSAHGSTRFTADTTAAAIKINIAQKDSVFTFDQGIYITKKQKFRNQQVAVLISVPVGKRISLPKSNSIANYDDNVWEFQNWNNENKLHQEFEMTDEGLREMDKLDRLDKLDDKINDKLDELEKLDKIDKLHKLDSLIEMEKNIKQEINQKGAGQDSI
jgi:phage shock protein PspC (stress-responsive transcriptional regulator)